jgi:para-aminobenzoate synthetase component 1
VGWREKSEPDKDRHRRPHRDAAAPQDPISAQAPEVKSPFHSEYPLVEAVQVASPARALRALAHLPSPFLLHSGSLDARARWSFFGADPFAVFHGDDVADARRLWRRFSEQVRAADPSPTLVPFTGGAVGYWSYDYGRRLERWSGSARDDLHLPDAVLMFYDVIGAFDHQTRQAWLFSSGLPLAEPLQRGRAEQRLEQFMRLLDGSRRVTSRLPRPREEPFYPHSTFTAERYRLAVEEVRRRIAAGDLFQANLSQRWTVPFGGDTDDRAQQHTDLSATAIALFESLDLFSAAPHAAYIGASDHAVVSASPERFLELRGRHVESRPIKGTRPRGATPDRDAQLKRELAASAKDRAENVMIVDVLRNDLGRVCETGSVTTPAVCEVETFSHVHHLVSTVSGELAAGRDAFDLLDACFPGGSITGAPKIRAMQVIDELEPVRRHVAFGSIGYLDWRGDADWNIAIRTALVTPRDIHFATGGGITADSDPDAEYQETLDKAEGMRLALERLVGPVRLAAGVAAPRG